MTAHDHMKIPGPDHPITIEPNRKRVRVVFNGRVVADTTHALTLREASLRPVLYIPRGDAHMDLFVRSVRTTRSAISPRFATSTFPKSIRCPLRTPV